MLNIIEIFTEEIKKIISLKNILQIRKYKFDSNTNSFQTWKIVQCRLKPEALQTPTVSLRSQALMLPSREDQHEQFKKILTKTCKDQTWPFICDVNIKGLGRGVITTDFIDKDQILADYHGKVVKGITATEYMADHPECSEYLFQISQKHLIDASNELCPVVDHMKNRCMARLINHNSPRHTNVKPVIVNLSASKSVLLMVAKHDIPPFEELRYDYGDQEARKMFSE